MPLRFLVVLIVFALCTPAEAQQPKKFRIGYLSSGAASLNLPCLEAFRQGLRDFGYVEGQNIVIERQDAAAELVRLKVDVIVTSGTMEVLLASRPP